MAGRGRPIVLLHAFGLTPNVYQRSIDVLARTNRVVAPWWLRVRHRDWSFERALACLDRLLDDERVEDAIVVGHSFGGAIATGIAAHRPDRIGELVLANALALSPGQEHLRRLGRPGRHWLALATGRAASGFFGMLYARPRNVARAAWFAYRSDLRDEVAAIRGSDVRSTVVWTRVDSLLPPDLGERTAEALDGRFHVVADPTNGGRLEHDWVFRHPGLFAATLAELGIIDGPAGGQE